MNVMSSEIKNSTTPQGAKREVVLNLKNTTFSDRKYYGTDYPPRCANASCHHPFLKATNHLKICCFF